MIVIHVIIDLGAAYGTAKSGVGITSVGVLKPDLIIKSIIPIIMAGILGIYGVIVAVLLGTRTSSSGDKLTMKEGYQYLAAGLCCGLSALASGLAIGVAGDAGVRAYA